MRCEQESILTPHLNATLTIGTGKVIKEQLVYVYVCHPKHQRSLAIELRTVQYKLLLMENISFTMSDKSFLQNERNAKILKKQDGEGEKKGK